MLHMKNLSIAVSLISARMTCPSSPAVNISYGLCNGKAILCTAPKCLNKADVLTLPLGAIIECRTYVLFV